MRALGGLLRKRIRIAIASGLPGSRSQNPERRAILLPAFRGFLTAAGQHGDSLRILLYCFFAMSLPFVKHAPARYKGVLLEDLTWQEAEPVLYSATVVVIPIGAGAKEHGFHLKLKNDWLLAEYFKQQVLQHADVVVAPTVNYHYYPAFLEYPGSISLRLETARDLMVDICRSLARYGPHKFYALNTGISTLTPLELAAQILEQSIQLRYFDLSKITESAEAAIEQEGGTHADEVETSMMLFIAPSTVDMNKAVKDFRPSAKGGLTRNLEGAGAYSVSGVYGDATLATRKKGELLVRAAVDRILHEIEEFQRT
jgi:creatinine amidohydrolase